MHPRCGAVASTGKSQCGRFFNLSGAALISIKGSDALTAINQGNLVRHHDRRTTFQSRRWLTLR
jgi:hypothetical protein